MLFASGEPCNPPRIDEELIVVNYSAAGHGLSMNNMVPFLLKRFMLEYQAWKIAIVFKGAVTNR